MMDDKLAGSGKLTVNQQLSNHACQYGINFSNLHWVQLIEWSQEDVVLELLHDVHKLCFPHQQRYSYWLKCSRYLEWDYSISTKGRRSTHMTY